MSGTKDGDAEATQGTAEDLTKAKPALAEHLARKHFGEGARALDSEKAHQLTAKIMREADARKRDQR